MYMMKIRAGRFMAAILSAAMMISGIPATAYASELVISDISEETVSELSDIELSEPAELKDEDIAGDEIEDIIEEQISEDAEVEPADPVDGIISDDTDEYKTGDISQGFAEDDVYNETASGNEVNYSHQYTRNAVIMDKTKLPGVYAVKAVKGDKKDADKATLGIPSLAKQNLQSAPTTESPAIIQGAAVPFEKRVNTATKIEFIKISDEPICAPYSKFRYKLMDEANTNTTGETHKKISGFDGTYVIMRIDVSDLIKDAPEGSYLHVKQENNKAMLTAVGQEPLSLEGEFSSVNFTDNTGTRAACYSLSNNSASLKDKDGISMDKPYVDVVMMSSGSIVAGADKGTTGAVSADIPISFYVDQVKDYDPSIEWDSTTNTVINVETRETVTDQTSGSVTKTAQSMILDKYYNEAKAKEAGLNDADITSYTAKGDDLELEVMVDETNVDTSTEKQYWSLRRAMDYQPYNKHTIRLMCEVPVLEGLLVEDTVGSKDREVVLDVNSFDIQIANHKDKNLAGLTVKGATLTVKDDSNTTGAELAVGNNASMTITDGGKLVIDRTCQVEVEYDAASVSAGSVPQDNVDYANGLITVNNGGEIENNGIITVEGKEGKAAGVDAAMIIRDYKDARLTIGEGGTLTNNGCVLVNGALYNLGTIINNGRYRDVITSSDPDKGTFTYHMGMQLSWKDDVTQGQTQGGMLFNGADDDNKVYAAANIQNNGDIVLIPGYLYNFSRVDNTGDIFMTSVDEVVIPITATQDAPTVTEERVKLGYPENSMFFNFKGSEFNNSGNVRTADFEITSNGRTGDLLSEVNPYYDELEIVNFGGKITNSGSGMIAVSCLRTYGEVSNSSNASFKGTFNVNGASKELATKVILGSIADGTGSFIDSAKTKTDSIYNGAKTSVSGTDTWTFDKIKKLSVTPVSASVGSGETVTWTLHAEPETKGTGIKYLIIYGGDNKADECFTLYADEDLQKVSPKAPAAKYNLLYYFSPQNAGSESTIAVIKVNDGLSSKLGVVSPTVMQDLVYNGEDQELVTSGFTTDGIMMYSLNDGEYSVVRPKAKNAGTYKVSYKVVSDETGSTVLDEGGSVNVTIAKRPLYMAADDRAGEKGASIKTLTYQAHGLMPADKDSLDIMLTTTAKSDSEEGSYPIKLTWKGSENYDYTNPDGSSRITDGTYHITKNYLNVTLSSNLVGYRNMNEQLGGFAKFKRDPAKATETLCNVYYSDKKPLDKSNYTTDGTKIAPYYAAVGTDVTVYYYIEEADVSGKQRVVITKGEQKAPGIKGQGGVLEAKADFQGAGGSTIAGFEERKMEYRGTGDDTYIRAVKKEHFVAPGTYYIRRMGDNRYYPSPETELVVPEPDTEVIVTFDPNGGTLNSASMNKIKYGEAVEKPADDPTRDTYNFVGWKDAYEFDDMLYDFSTPVSRNLELRAVWDIQKYTVTFDSKGGSDIPSKRVEINQTVARPADPVREGYDFTGWKKDGADYNFDSPVTSDITLEAGWEAHKYNVVFDANGGSGSMASIELAYGAEIVLTKNAFTREGYEYCGWNLSADGSKKTFEDEQSVSNLTSKNGETITMYAQWKKTLKSADITVSVEDGGIKYTGREVRPNVTVMDGIADITRYCRLTYSDNVDAGEAKVTVSIQGTNPKYSNKETREETFTIGKADYTASVVELSAEYFNSESASDAVDIMRYLSKLPADRGTTEFSATVSGDIVCEKTPTIEHFSDTGKLMLSYSLKPSDKESQGKINVIASMKNYHDSVVITVNIHQIDSVIYRKEKKEYYPFFGDIITGAKCTLVLKTATGVLNKGVEWTSSDPSVAAISKSGALKAKKAGNTTIKAKSGDISAECIVQVSEAVKKVNIDKKSYPMGIGESVVLTADTLPSEADKTIVWSVSKTKASVVEVTVSDDTKSITVKAVGKGSVKLTATAADGSKKKATCSISVGDPVTGLTVQGKSGKKVLETGKKLGMQVKWEGKPKNKQVTWKVTRPDGTDASNIAEISAKGVLTGKSEGKVRVTAVSVSNPAKSSYTDIEIYVPVKKIALSATKGEINLSDASSSQTVSVTVTSKTAGLEATGEVLGTKPVFIFEPDSKYADKLVIESSSNTAVIKAAPGAAPAKNIPVKVTVKAFNGYSKTLTYKVTLK